MTPSSTSGADIRRYKLFLDNEPTAARDDATFESIDPARGVPMATLARASADDVDRAVAGARAAQNASWWAGDPLRRARVLNTWADLIEQHAGDLAELESRDNGRPLRETSSQSVIIAQWYRYFAGIADKIEGSNIPVGPSYLNYTERVPLGVVGAITPWNHPLLITSKKLAPALAAGNSVVLKPSELAPCSLIELALLGREAGLPPGVLQVVTGYGAEAGAALASHPTLARVDVTGSTATGKVIAAAAGSAMTRFAGELGGKAPVIVFDDADIDRAVRGTQFAGFIGAGQTCIAGSRILLQRGIHDEFVTRLIARVERMRVGLPQDPRTQMGPQISAAARERIEGFVASAQDEGARLATGGGRPTDPELREGYFLRPTVLVDGDTAMECAQEEIFGPVLVVIAFEDEQDAIRIANDVRYGLGAGIWTRDVGRAHRVARAVRSGTTWVNNHHRNHPGSPWGGFGDSGYGRENGMPALLDYTEVKSVWVDLTDDPITWYDDDSGQRLN